jgi:hypothetical protein
MNINKKNPQVNSLLEYLRISPYFQSPITTRREYICRLKFAHHQPLIERDLKAIWLAKGVELELPLGDWRSELSSEEECVRYDPAEWIFKGDCSRASEGLTLPTKVEMTDKLCTVSHAIESPESGLVIRLLSD